MMSYFNGGEKLHGGRSMMKTLWLRALSPDGRAGIEGEPTSTQIL